MVLDFKRDNVGCTLESGALFVQVDSDTKPIWVNFKLQNATPTEAIEAAILIGRLLAKWHMTLSLVTLDMRHWPDAEFWRYANEQMCYFCCIGSVRLLACPSAIVGQSAIDALMLQFSCSTLVLEGCTGVDIGALTQNMRKIKLLVCKYCEYAKSEPIKSGLQRAVIYGDRYNVHFDQSVDVKFLA